MRTMGTRARSWIVVLLVAVPVGLVLGRLRQAHDWNLLELYGAMAIAFTALVTPAMLWIDSAPDGPMRHRKRR